MYTFDIGDLVISVNGRIINDYAEGSNVTVKNVQPKLQPHYGLQGTVGVARNGVKAKQVTFQVMSNSPDCKALLDLSERGAIFDCSYVDMNDNGRSYSSGKSFMEEVPEYQVGGEIGAVDVTITLPLGG